MADPAHLNTLRQGHAAWTAWREANKGITPDLRDEILDLGSQPARWNFSRCLLTGCTIQGAGKMTLDFSDADVSTATFSERTLIDGLQCNQHTKFDKARFVRVNISQAEFSVEQLTNVDFSRAELTAVTFHGSLQEVKFNIATLSRVTFTDCTLVGCPMSSSEVKDSTFENAIFVATKTATEKSPSEPEKVSGTVSGTFAGSKFTRCSFLDAKFNCIPLTSARFVDCDLTRVSGIVLDDNLMRGTALSPHADDDWSVLRRKYTGANMIFNLIFLVVFFLPWIFQVFYWSSVNKFQSAVVATAAAIETDLVQLPPGEVKDQLMKVMRRLANPGLERCFRSESTHGAAGCFRLWQVLLGVHEGWLAVTLGVMLLVYNLARLLLTWFVAPLRDEERRSYHSPSRNWRRNDKLGVLFNSYGWMMPFHCIVKYLFYIAIISAIAHLGPKFFLLVWVGE